MQHEVPIAPQLLQRAAQGESAALSALVCARKERAYSLALSLSAGALDSDLASDVTASMEELADACALPCVGRAASWENPSSDAPSGGTFAALDGAGSNGWPSSTLLQQALLRRWHMLHALCRAVAALGYEERALLVLIDMEGLESDQAAWLLGFREAELHARLLSARSCLRKHLLAGNQQRRSAQTQAARSVGGR